MLSNVGCWLLLADLGHICSESDQNPTHLDQIWPDFDHVCADLTKTMDE